MVPASFHIFFFLIYSVLSCICGIQKTQQTSEQNREEADSQKSGTN